MRVQDRGIGIPTPTEVKRNLQTLLSRIEISGGKGKGTALGYHSAIKARPRRDGFAEGRGMDFVLQSLRFAFQGLPRMSRGHCGREAHLAEGLVQTSSGRLYRQISDRREDA